MVAVLLMHLANGNAQGFAAIGLGREVTHALPHGHLLAQGAPPLRDAASAGISAGDPSKPYRSDWTPANRQNDDGTEHWVMNTPHSLELFGRVVEAGADP